MRLYDQHLHTWFSTDSKADPAANVRRALEVGLSGLTFTDHFDTHPMEADVCRYDYDRLAETVASLRREHGDRIFIGHGIEVCYQRDQMERILAFLEPRRFDLVLLSVHWFDGRALHIREHWDGVDTAAATRGYLEAVLEAVRLVGELRRQGQRPFDVLGHLDLVKRYTQRYFEQFDVRSYAELVDEILAGCLAAELVPEINLSSLRQSIPEPMPASWVARRYAELGGTAMTLGSDAHTPAAVGAGIAEGAALLRESGIRHVAVFQERRRRDETIEAAH